MVGYSVRILPRFGMQFGKCETSLQMQVVPQYRLLSYSREHLKTDSDIDNAYYEKEIASLESKHGGRDEFSNIRPRIMQKLIDADLSPHTQTHHPICMIRKRIENVMQKINTQTFKSFTDLHPVVTSENNFDRLLIPKDHVSRTPSDTYYVNKNTCLRTHTSAHQYQLLSQGHNRFLVCGKTFRRDEIDSSHYPVFHQMEGVKLFSSKQLNEQYGVSFGDVDFKPHHVGVERESIQSPHSIEVTNALVKDLKSNLEMVVKELFGDLPMKWSDSYFPFTHPSYELEIEFDGKWLEVLGCGVIEQKILTEAGVERRVGWAFGLGMERLAMILYDIPDIRLFWSKDPRFLNQFSETTPDVKFSPFSKYTPCYKDISMWILCDDFDDNDFFDFVRQYAGDLIENVEKTDEFFHPKRKMTSKTYRITYRSLTRTLTNDFVNKLHQQSFDRLQSEFNIELRV